MRKFYVMSPEYGTVIPVTDEGEGPMEWNRDVVEVEASTRSDARVLGLRLLRQLRRGYFDRHDDGDNPFAGMQVELVWPDGHEDCDCADCRPWTI